VNDLRVERLLAGYLVVQALVGVAWWAAMAWSPPIRRVFELDDLQPAVLDSLVFADVVVIIVGGSLAAWALERGATRAVPLTAAVAGGLAYVTLYLIGWVTFTGEGALCAGVMVPPTLLSGWVAWQAYRLHHPPLGA